MPEFLLEIETLLLREFLDITRDAPIVIDAAMFEDGTEEGSESTLKFMHKIRARERARHKAEKEGQPAERKPNQ